MLWHLRPTLRPLQFGRRCARKFPLFYTARTIYSGVNGPPKTPWLASLPSFRQQLARTSEIPSFTEKVKRPSQRNQILFFLFGSYCAFSVAAAWTNEDTYVWSNMLSSSAAAWRYRPPTNDEMRKAKYFLLGKTLQGRLGQIKDAIEEFPQSIKAMMIWTYIQLAQPALDTTEGRRWCWVLGTTNGIMYLAWQFPRVRSILQARCIHNPLSGLSYTMLTSLFTYKSLPHVILSSMALATFGSATTQYLFEEHSKNPDNLRESTAKWHLFAFFTSAGLFSNLFAHIVAARFTFPRIVSHLRVSSGSTAAAARSKTKLFAKVFSTAGVKESPSAIPTFFGASGAIYAMIAVSALQYPDTLIAMHIPPTLPIPIGLAWDSLILLDLIGVWRGWRLFNHWAHLGGTLFGVLYWRYGPEVWEFFRELTIGSLPPELCDFQEDSQDPEEE